MGRHRELYQSSVQQAPYYLSLQTHATTAVPQPPTSTDKRTLVSDREDRRKDYASSKRRRIDTPSDPFAGISSGERGRTPAETHFTTISEGKSADETMPQENRWRGELTG